MVADSYHVACYVASLGGDAKLVRLLVENGADVNKKDSDGNSVLMVSKTCPVCNSVLMVSKTCPVCNSVLMVSKTCPVCNSVLMVSKTCPVCNSVLMVSKTCPVCNCFAAQVIGDI